MVELEENHPYETTGEETTGEETHCACRDVQI
jgi:hypothetical protein